METTKEYMGDNMIFLTASMRSVPVGYDYKGDLRWYSNHNFAFDIKRMPNGHILVGTERLVKCHTLQPGYMKCPSAVKCSKNIRAQSADIIMTSL